MGKMCYFGIISGRLNNGRYNVNPENS